MKELESFEGIIRTTDDVQFRLGIDYNLGDIVTIEDKEINVRVSARVNEIEQSFEGGNQITNIVFGYTKPTIMQKINNIKNN